jgi:hypothetical protein
MISTPDSNNDNQIENSTQPKDAVDTTSKPTSPWASAKIPKHLVALTSNQGTSDDIAEFIKLINENKKGNN